jgi:hypothetical protein
VRNATILMSEVEWSVVRWVSLKVNGCCHEVPVVSACPCLVSVAAGTASLFVNLTSLTLLEQSLLQFTAVKETIGTL